MLTHYKKLRFLGGFTVLFTGLKNVVSNLRLVIWYSGDLKGGVVQFLAKNIFKFSLDQFENTRYALESGRFWFLRYHGRCKVMSHFFWLYASLNIRPLHCTQEAEYKVSLSYIFRMYLHLLESRCSLRSPPSPVASSHRIIFVLYCHHSYILSLYARSWI